MVMMRMPMKGLSAFFISTKFLRVENSLQKVDLWFNDTEKAISMPFDRKSFAPYTATLYTGGGEAAGGGLEEGKAVRCAGIDGDLTGAFG